MPNLTNVTKAMEAVDANPDTKELILTFGDKKVQRGEYIPRKGAQAQPTLSWSGAVPGKTYLLLGLDLDAPFATLPILGPVLHGILPGFQTSGESSTVLKSEVPVVAEYIAPAPPPLSGPHRYVFLLYEQPAAFDAKKFRPQKDGEEFPIMKRVRFDPDNFVKEAELGEVLAGGWFESN
ncbi:putative Phosphatidylethanolamine-binding protein [Seiridium unicorne]|uniref:Phosphatidylethanolamine-binding protein n=1 Tax=Seiridium unicorne TaxID=138068 RepID=A0ABR2VDH5_9PEZI